MVPIQEGSAGAKAPAHKMPTAYWLDVSQCETQSNWQDGGRFAGGLGIAVTTWVNYGGREFARTPDRATMEEQIEVAHRISVTGYQTKHTYLTLEDRLNNKPFFRPPAGFFGWGCIRQNRYLHPKNWLKRRLSKTASKPLIPRDVGRSQTRFETVKQFRRVIVGVGVS